jgi:histidinol-phosphate aminotransferase
MTGRPRPAVAALPGYVPGRSAAAAAAEHGIADAIKMASNELPFGPLPAVAGAISAGIEDIGLYADHRATALREELAAFVGVESEQVTIGAGSAGILQQLLLSYVNAGEKVAMCWPSFEAYPLFAALVEAEQVRIPLVDETFDLLSLATAIDDNTKLVFVTNPNNPTGTVVGTDQIVDFLHTVPTSCLVVLDEAYSEFVTDPRVRDSTQLLAAHSNLVITRTFSKAHGLAGLRVGYALAHPDVIGMIDRTLVPFAVNELAQRAARASLHAADEMRERVAAVVSERGRVVAALREFGWTVPEPQGNFIWLPVLADAAALGADLERRGVVTRAFADVGVRVTIAGADWNDRFLAALQSVRPNPTS